MDCVLQHVLSKTTDVSLTWLEDLALCVARVAGMSESDRADLAEIVERWVAGSPPERPATRGRRQQLLLRTVVDILLDRGCEKLTREEVDFLRAADVLAARDSGGRNDRLSAVIGPYREALRDRQQKLQPSSGPSMLQMHVRIITPEQIEQSARKQVALFEGQDEPPPGPTFETAGPVRILGSIPDHCTVIVTDGHCAVDGYVLGRLAAHTGCDVRENIAGSIVATTGDIRCRNIIQKALVVAKTGSIYFSTAMSPATVFAGKKMVASEHVIRGVYHAGEIEVGKSVRGGQIHVTDSLTASELISEDDWPLDIVLRDEMSFQDFGERTSPAAVRLKARAARVGRRLDFFTKMAVTTQAEAEHAASTALLHAFSGIGLVGLLDERARLARRIDVLNRLTDTLHALYAGAEAAFGFAETPDDDDVAGLLLTEMETELEELNLEGSLREDTVEDRETVRGIYEQLGWTRNDHTARLGVLSQLHARLEGWLAERQELVTTLQRLNKKLAVSVPEAGLAQPEQDASPSRESRLLNMRKHLLALKNNPPNAELQRRLQSPLVSLMFNTMDRRFQRLNELAVKIQKCRDDLNKATEELRTRFSICTKSRNGVPPKVTGKFSADVRIYPAVCFLEDPDAAPGAVHVTEAGMKDVATFSRGLGGVVRKDDA